MIQRLVVQILIDSRSFLHRDTEGRVALSIIVPASSMRCKVGCTAQRHAVGVGMLGYRSSRSQSTQPLHRPAKYVNACMRRDWQDTGVWLATNTAMQHGFGKKILR